MLALCCLHCDSPEDMPWLVSQAEKGRDNILPKIMASSDNYDALFQVCLPARLIAAHLTQVIVRSSTAVSGLPLC